MNQCIASAKTTLPLGADANVAVTGPAGAVFGLAAGRKAESFFDPFVGLHFVGHRSTFKLSKLRIRDFIDPCWITEGVKLNFGRKSAKTDQAWESSGKT